MCILEESFFVNSVIHFSKALSQRSFLPELVCFSSVQSHLLIDAILPALSGQSLGFPFCLVFINPSCNSMLDVDDCCQLKHTALSAFCLTEHPWAGVLASPRMVPPRAGQKANYFHNQNVNKARYFMDISMEIANFQTKYELFSENLAVSIAVSQQQWFRSLIFLMLLWCEQLAKMIHPTRQPSIPHEEILVPWLCAHFL